MRLFQSNMSVQNKEGNIFFTDLSSFHVMHALQASEDHQTFVETEPENLNCHFEP